MDSVGGRAMIYLWISRSVSLSTFDINFISRHQQKAARDFISANCIYSSWRKGEIFNRQTQTARVNVEIDLAACLISEVTAWEIGWEAHTLIEALLSANKWQIELRASMARWQITTAIAHFAAKSELMRRIAKIETSDRRLEPFCRIRQTAV